MSETNIPDHVHIQTALAIFASMSQKVQSQRHIKPLHQHLAIRLVIEGGFRPDEVVPHPPLALKGRNQLVWDPNAATTSEQTVLGGVKTKNIDVVVSKPGIGPVVAISVKGTTGAFRNLTNRMEEAIGDSTNLHIMYPGLVYGFCQVVRANRRNTDDLTSENDVAVEDDGEPVMAIRRYHDVLLSLTGRKMVRDDPTRYEALALALVSREEASLGSVLPEFPTVDSPLRIERFLDDLLRIYDLRFPYMAASVSSLRRLEWSQRSPAFKALGDSPSVEQVLGYCPRIE